MQLGFIPNSNPEPDPDLTPPHPSRAQPLIKFILYADGDGKSWRIRAVTAEGTLFTNRVSLHEAWRGLRDEELSQCAGIEGCTFVHAAGVSAWVCGLFSCGCACS